MPMTHVLESTVDFCMDDVELYVYTGADGTFDLYDDAGDGYDYEQGGYTLQHIAWDDGRQKLSITCSKAGVRKINTPWNPKVHLM